MSNVLFDSNIIIDWVLERKPFYEVSKSCIDKCINHGIKGYVTPHSISDIFYIVRKEIGITKTKDFMEVLFNIFSILTENQETFDLIMKSFEWKDNLWNDIEDAMQMSAAQLNKMDLILTRNPKDYELAQVCFMTPEEFVKL